MQYCLTIKMKSDDSCTLIEAVFASQEEALDFANIFCTTYDNMIAVIEQKKPKIPVDMIA